MENWEQFAIGSEKRIRRGNRGQAYRAFSPFGSIRRQEDGNTVEVWGVVGTASSNLNVSKQNGAVGKHLLGSGYRQLLNV